MTDIRTLGRLADCDLVVDDDSVAPIHAHAEAGEDGHIGILDAGSETGTWLNRNQQWIRVLKVELGSSDRIRLGDREIDVDRLVDLFGDRVRVRLRDHDDLRLPQRPEQQARPAFERPRRNPETGKIEEDR